ncbi:MAG: hypothetical protein JWL81_1079, partial [Verrucomicrobiales bacterium]|nr:hypothetical protein [Verrucomicrobiales bacterium]
MRIAVPWVVAGAVLAAGGGFAARRWAWGGEALRAAGLTGEGEKSPLIPPGVSDATPAGKEAMALALKLLRATPQELAGFFREEMRRSPGDDLKRRFLVMRWSQVDPAGCLEAMAAAGGPEAWSAVMAAWMDRDAKAAAAWFLNHSALIPVAGRRTLTEELMARSGDERLFSVDPGDGSDVSGSDTMRENFLTSLWKSSPAEALRRIGTPDAPGEYFGQAAQIMESWARQDPEAMRAWVDLEKHPNMKAGYMAAAVAGFADADLGRAADWLAREKVATSQLQDAMGDLLTRWGGVAPLEALTWGRRSLEVGEGGGGDEMLGRVFTEASKKGLVQALGLLAEAGFDEAATIRICRQWGGPDDPALSKEIWRELRNVPAGKARSILVESIALDFGWAAAADPALAAELASLTDSPADRKMLEAAILRTGSNDSGEAGLAVLRDPALPVTTDHVYNTARLRPAEVATALLQRPDATPEHYAQLISGWEEVDPAAAARWVQALPTSAQARSAAAEMAFYWGADDAAAASGWVAGLPASPERD